MQIIPISSTDEHDVRQRVAELRRWDLEAMYPSVDTEEYILGILNYWAPLAERLGMHAEQTEMQELAIKLGFPEDYRRLKALLLESEMRCDEVFRTFSLPIRTMLDDLGIEYEYKYRMKSVYSVWRKMKLEGKKFDDVFDLFATRIVYKPQPADAFVPEYCLDDDPEVAAVRNATLLAIDPERYTCWRIYTVIALLYRVQHDRIKNWIRNPKPSGYQAFHMTVKGPESHWVEIQIRSERMDQEAEHGAAAHWKYKSVGEWFR